MSKLISIWQMIKQKKNCLLDILKIMDDEVHPKLRLQRAFKGRWGSSTTEVTEGFQGTMRFIHNCGQKGPSNGRWGSSKTESSWGSNGWWDSSSRFIHYWIVLGFFQWMWSFIVGSSITEAWWDANGWWVGGCWFTRASYLDDIYIFVQRMRYMVCLLSPAQWLHWPTL